jgi:CubicO group peptidase (beta-lactamase class C family)
MPFERYVQTTVLNELHMDASSYRLEGDLQVRLANSHMSMLLLLTVFAVLGVLLCGATGGVWWLAARFRRARPPFSPRARRALLAVSLTGAAVAFVGLTHSLVVLLPIGLSLVLLLLVLRLSLRLLQNIRKSRDRRMFLASGAMRLGALLGAVVLLVLIVSRPAVPLPLKRELGIAAAGGLYSTAPDLARFMIELMDPQRIDPTLIHQMLQPQVHVSEYVSWGLGIGLQHNQLGDSFWHWGNNPGYESLMIGYPAQKIGVVILTNGGPAWAGLTVARRVAHRAIGGEHYSYWKEVPGVFWPSRHRQLTERDDQGRTVPD